MIRHLQNADDVARARRWHRRAGVLFGTPMPVQAAAAVAAWPNAPTAKGEGAGRAPRRNHRDRGRHDASRGVRDGGSARDRAQRRRAAPSRIGRPTPEGEAFATRIIAAAYESGFRPTVRNIHRRMLAEWDMSLGIPPSYDACRRRARGMRPRFVLSGHPVLDDADDRGSART